VPRLLVPHPSTPLCQFRLEVACDRAGAALFAARCRVGGPVAALRIPGRASARRADGLWRTTCFEAFVRPDGGDAYYEYNFSPSGEWAAYRFDAYRAGMTPFACAAPEIRMAVGPDSLEWAVRAPLPAATTCRVGLSAVLEGADGEKSYWALAHPHGPPDFHHADCFAAELPQYEAP
jgi:hypothetical protein